LQERTTWQYDVVGRIVTLTHANGATAGYSYNAAGWVTQVAHRKPDGSVLETFDYTYDAVGNRLTRGTTDYTYDAANQLTGRDITGSLVLVSSGRGLRSLRQALEPLLGEMGIGEVTGPAAEHAQHLQ
jgi:YD repeat-containing protein